MIHPDTELRFINAVIGFGVVATKPIPCGTITWVRDALDLTMNEERARSLGALFREQLDKFTFTDGGGQRVLCWDIARYVNHACDAPCLAAGYEFELAVRDIAAGEQLCDDYGALNIAEPFDCACGSPRCRKVIRPTDHLKLADEWDARLSSAFPAIAAVDQPLWSLVKEKAAVAEALRDPSRRASCRVHFLKQPAA